MRIFFVLFLLSQPVFTPAALAFDESCQWPKAPFLSLGRSSFVTEISDQDFLWSIQTPPTASYQEFQTWAQRQPNLFPAIAKIQFLREIYEQKAPQSPVAGRLRQIESGAIGEVSSIRCLEALLFDEAQSLRPQQQAPYEMGALILRKELPTGKRLKIYLELGDAGSLSFYRLDKLVTEDLKNGWILMANLHSHPFSTEASQILMSGAVAPSETDLRTYQRDRREKGLEQAWITNGVHSFRMTHEEFDWLAEFNPDCALDGSCPRPFRPTYKSEPR